MAERLTKLEISGFPDDLRRRFKAATATNGKSMSEVAIELVAAYCDEQETDTKEEAGNAAR